MGVYPYGNDMKVFVSTTRLSKTSPYRLVRVMTLRCLVAGFLEKKLGLMTLMLRRSSSSRGCEFIE